MASDRTGTVETFTRADGSKYHRAKVRLGDGTRERVDIPDKHAGTPQRRALFAQAMQEREDETGELLAKKRARLAERAAQRDPLRGETCTAYRDRLNDHRAELGKGGRKDDESTWRVWIAPLLGALPIAKVTREDVEKLRDTLDAAIAKHRATDGAEGVSPKRALNVWSVVTTTFKAAVAAKRRDLRVREDNPCAGVLPPEQGESRRRPWVYPAELVAVARCLDVGLEWREVYAIGAYLYLRPAELHVLTWGDVDLDARIVHVTKAWNERAKVTEEPKTANGVRDVPIPEALVPLLARMRRAEDGSDRPADELVCPIVAGTPESKRAPKFVAALRAAGVKRPRLFSSTATTMGANFRTLRDSGITWLALAGTDVVRMQRRAGHDDVKTTLDYVKQAEDLTGAVGEPFGPLPAELVEGRMGKGDVPPTSQGRRPRYRSKYRSKLPDAPFQTLENTAQNGGGGGSRIRPVCENRPNSEGAGQNDAADCGVSARILVSPGPPGPVPEGDSGEGGAADPVPPPTPGGNPRGRLLAALGAAIGELVGAGDHEGARIAHEAVARLLASAASAPAGVLDLGAERARRGRP